LLHDKRGTNRAKQYTYATDVHGSVSLSRVDIPDIALPDVDVRGV
jgi:hypothetical protein